VNFPLAQVNVGRIRGPMESDFMRAFREYLDQIGTLDTAAKMVGWTGLEPCRHPEAKLLEDADLLDD